MRVINNPKGWINKDQIKRLVKQLQKTELHKEFLQKTKYKSKNERGNLKNTKTSKL